MALFESLRLCEGTLHFASAHWESLERAAIHSRFPLPHDARPALEALFKAYQGEWFVRIYLTAGDGSPRDPVVSPRLLVFAEPRMRAQSVPWQISWHPAPYLAPRGGLKTANYWFNVQALSDAQAEGYSETLLFHPDGRLVSAAMANVFLKIAGDWITPELDAGARDGVLRRWTLEQLRVKVSPLFREDVRRAESIFLTNSWLGIQPVQRCGDTPLDFAAEIPLLQGALEAANPPPNQDFAAKGAS
ncbi:MAG: aminodeoxychorismate lyase [Verrucomicrobiota bacterium]|jgi:branched-subunit amino acid aminotransferase/4-amino-4-deoxychorismate lyase